MLSHKVITGSNISLTTEYYEGGLDDYYAKEGEASEWQGIGAANLGLIGPVNEEQFRNMLSGKTSPNGEISRNSTRLDSKKRLGVDFTFSPPKSVSIQALVGGDKDIIKAHDLAVKRTLEAAEKFAQTRIKKNGKSMVVDTGNLAIAKFRHETSREQDPQLHTHAFIMNITQRSDGNWRALKNDKLIKSTKYLGSVYNAELAVELQKLGYSLRFEKEGNFELSHINREQIKGMSQRREQIENALEEKGLDINSATAIQKQQATLETRSKKEKVARADLHKEWKDRAQDLGINFDRREWAGVGAEYSDKNSNFAATMKETSKTELANNAIKYAINHHTERQSVIERATLINTALEHSIGHLQLNHIEEEIERQKNSGYLIQEEPLYKTAAFNPGEKEEIKSRAEWIKDLQDNYNFNKKFATSRVDKAIKQGGLVPGEIRYTTQTALEREKGILKIELEGRAAIRPIMESSQADLELSASNLNTGQKEAAKLIATTNNRVVGIQGFAGVGKSHMLDTAKKMIEDNQFNVRALAPYATQVGALRELNVEANTLASFLKAKEKNINDKTVLVIDEAGTVPTRQMQQVLSIAEKHGARVVLMGDNQQTKAVEAGRPFDQLQNAGMTTAKITEIHRQKDARLKRAVQLAAKGDQKTSLRYIKDVEEIADSKERYQAIAKEYGSLSAADRDKTIIVSGTNIARKSINHNVRKELGLTGKGTIVSALIRQDTTQAERKFSKNYAVGDVIQPEKDYKNSGLKRGEIYKILDTGPGNRLTVQSEKDESQVIQYNPSTHSKISVYKREDTELTPGDLVRITRNDAELDIANGDRFKVKEITEEGKTVLDNGSRTIELDNNNPLHLAHAYATTVHSSQGLTSDRVIIDADTESRTTSKDVYYVAISRARHVSKIFTNKKDDLPKSISRENLKYNAHDLKLKKGAYKQNIDKSIQKPTQIEKTQIQPDFER